MKDKSGQGYRCGSEKVAQQKLPWQPPESITPMQQAILDPNYPLVLCVLEGVQALRENLVEAQIAAELALCLRSGLQTPLPPTPIGDRRFWAERLFMVSPHHTQLIALRKALAQNYPWLSTPFVDTVDKMQGQEADCVIVSYGVSDVEAALTETDFIYSLQRLNVAITRARSKCIVFLSRPLLTGSPIILNDAEASRGWAYMQQLEDFCAQGEQQSFALDAGAVLKVYRV